MRFKLPLVFLCALTLATAGSTRAFADELADKGRAIFKKNQRAVVTVQVVVKVTYSQAGRSAQPVEAKQDTTGTVVDPSGLTVLALSQCDPSSLYETLTAGGDSGTKMETEVSDVKILLDDGTELPSEIVLRDKDQDLAFIRPKSKPANPLVAIDLGKSAPAQVLDQVIALNRLGQAAGRAYSAAVERISAVIEKPRLLYIPDSTMTTTALGSPAFAMDGNVVGLFVMRAVSARGGSGSRSARDSIASVIVPAEDVLKASRQAPPAKPESKPESGEANK